MGRNNRRRSSSVLVDERRIPEDPDHDDQYDSLLKETRERSADPRHTAPVNFQIKVGNYERNVHVGSITKESGFFKMMTSSAFKEATSHVLHLPEDDPELVARMILLCYYDTYPLSPSLSVAPGAPSVAKVMEDNYVISSKDDQPFEQPVDYRYDALLHLKMHVLAEKFDMERLQSRALARCLSALTYEPDGFWACMGLLDGMPEHLATEVERVLIQSDAGREVNTVAEKFKRLEGERPETAKRMREPEWKSSQEGASWYFLTWWQRQNTSRPHDEVGTSRVMVSKPIRVR